MRSLLAIGVFEMEQQNLTLRPQKAPAKLFHKKARTGCSSCRLRRVKCDESKPVCLNCNRLNLECRYEVPKPRTRRNFFAQSSRAALSQLDEGFVSPLRLPETEERRKLELELFYHYCTETGRTIAPATFSDHFWSHAICEAALRSDAVLYCVCLLAALHKCHQAGTPDMALSSHVSRYLGAALYEHHKDVLSLTVDSVDNACFASGALRIYRWTELQSRKLEPYRPPTDWLRLINASRFMFTKAAALSEMSNNDSIGKEMLDNAWELMDEQLEEENLKFLAHLLSREQPHELEEPWDENISSVYTAAITQIGSLWKEKDEDRLSPILYRGMAIFPMLIDPRFIDLVEERRPRALVALAHYFAILSLCPWSWYIGNAAFRETRAIANELSPEWQPMLREPLEIIARAAGRRDKAQVGSRA